MERPEAPRTGGPRRFLRRPAALLLAGTLFSMFAVTGCAHSPAEMAAAAVAGSTPAAATTPATPATTAAATHVAMGGAQGMDMVPADAAAAWAARPAFVNASAETQEAYAYALYHPNLVRWMPCYCGCGGMGHTSNLDCYLKKSIPGTPTRFEEHASYCDICVQTTLTLKRLVGEGKSLREIRTVIDQQFGRSGVPGTPTELPSA